MTPLGIALAGGGVLGGSGSVALLLARAPRLATTVAMAGALAGGVAGLWCSIGVLAGGWTGELSLPWRIPGGELVLGLDPLSAFFLAPVLVLGALCALYGRSYLGARALPAAELNLLLGAMTLVLLARHALLFLAAWEGMTLLAFLLVTLEHGEAEVRRAGWVYLIASHVAVLALVALFLGLGSRAGGALDFTALARAPAGPALATAGLLFLALLGFGTKAGVVGLHVWLPEAHAAAPSHVSALMSGALVKLGLYGLLRCTLLVAPGQWFGVALMVLGLLGALLGIALALQQRDLKRLLAYSTVENVGIVLVALGLGLWARSRDDVVLSAIAFGAGLLHVWNHAAMKGLLFLGAGSVVHGARTRDLERLGGLLRRMPWTGGALLVGAVAIAALPPLNGFTGEWLLYRGLVRVALGESAPAGLAAMAGAAGVALVGGLAALCFVRLIGTALLGSPRGGEAAGAHESPPAMTIPLAGLAAACLAGALAAPALVRLQGALLRDLGGATSVEVAACAELLDPLVRVDAVLLGAILLGTVLLVRRVRPAAATGTWDCGYVSPTARMQYGARGFSELASSSVLPRWLRPRLWLRPPQGPFPGAASFAGEDGDPLTRGLYEPFLARCGTRFSRLRVLQQGNVHVYVLYILSTAVAALAWVALRDWFWS